MTQDWESRFRAWIAGPSQTEETRSENAIRGITNAITSSDALRRRSIKVFVQGSYRNHVNVRQDSDVDVGVMLYSDSFFANYPAGKSASDFGNSRSGYSYSQFKSDLCDALIRRFGSKLVTRANKAIKVRANSYHVEADVAPFLEHREYQNDRTYYGGVQLNPDRGGEILNYPEHLLPSSWRYRNGHYENGRDKNSATSRRFKRVVRILKKLRIGMENAGFPSASTIPGYLLECMAWNVASYHFSGDSWFDRVKTVLHCISIHVSGSSNTSWSEVDGIKQLFHDSQPWSQADAHSFINSARRLIGAIS